VFLVLVADGLFGVLDGVNDGLELWFLAEDRVDFLEFGVRDFVLFEGAENRVDDVLDFGVLSAGASVATDGLESDKSVLLWGEWVDHGDVWGVVRI